ncbi:MAG TPA: MFS transporter, partial [Acidimicrobiales bacterium]
MSALDGRFWRIWAASAVSTLGDGVRVAALPLLAATLTRDPIAVASVAVAQGLPWALFALLSGALVDRLDRRLIMGYTDLFRFVVTGGLVVLVATHHTSIAALCVVAFCLGSAETMFDNASQAILPAVVARPHLELANSRLASVEIVTRDFVGPPFGALLFTLAALVPFAVDSASFAVAAV